MASHNVSSTVSAEQRRQMIAEAAYFRAERRGFNGGDPLRDWVEAEAEVDGRLNRPEHEAALALLEERFATVGKKLQALRKKVAGLPAEARSEWQLDLERLTGLRDTLEARLKEMREQGEQATHKVKEQGERIWQEIAEIIQRRTSRRKAEPRA